MNNIPKISIITPAYNSEKTIEQTIYSVLNQSFSDFEHIIVDDGSTDKTIEIIEKITDPRIKLIKKENGGASSARNAGIKEARADIIAFIDSDDLWLKDRLKLDYEIFAHSKYKEKALIAPFFMINTVDEIVHLSPMFNYPEPVWKYQKFAPQFFNPGSLMIDRSIIEKLGYFRTDLYFHEDYDFALKVTANYPIIFSPHRLLLYRYYFNSKGKRNLDLYNDEKNHPSILKKFFREQGERFDKSFQEEAIDLCYRTELFALLSLKGNFKAAKMILDEKITNKKFLYTTPRGILILFSLFSGINLVKYARKTVQTCYKFYFKAINKKSGTN